MKLTEIEERIQMVLYECTDISGRLILRPAKDILTDLFIELSNERCKEQKNICAKSYLDIYVVTPHRHKSEAILNAPLPALD